MAFSSSPITIRNEIINTLKQNSELAGLVLNLKSNEPIINKTSIENLNQYDLPAICVYLPKVFDFTDSNNENTQSNIYFIDVVEQHPDFIQCQDNALILALKVKSVIANNYYTARYLSLEISKLEVTKIEEIGVFNQNKIFQFAYRIHIKAYIA